MFDLMKVQRSFREVIFDFALRWWSHVRTCVQCTCTQEIWLNLLVTGFENPSEGYRPTGILFPPEFDK